MTAPVASFEIAEQGQPATAAASSDYVSEPRAPAQNPPARASGTGASGTAASAGHPKPPSRSEIKDPARVQPPAPATGAASHRHDNADSRYSVRTDLARPANMRPTSNLERNKIVQPQALANNVADPRDSHQVVNSTPSSPVHDPPSQRRASPGTIASEEQSPEDIQYSPQQIKSSQLSQLAHGSQSVRELPAQEHVDDHLESHQNHGNELNSQALQIQQESPNSLLASTLPAAMAMAGPHGTLATNMAQHTPPHTHTIHMPPNAHLSAPAGLPAFPAQAMHTNHAHIHPVPNHHAAAAVAAVHLQQHHLLHAQQHGPHITTQLWVPQNRVGMVIGAHGAVIKTLQERSNATIRVHNDKINANHKLFTIVGGQAECARARALITDIVDKPRATSQVGGVMNHTGSVSPAPGGLYPQYSADVRPGDVARAVYVPNACVGIVIGRGGETIRDLQARSGATIKVTPDKDVLQGSETRSIMIIGSAQAVLIAHQLVTDVVQEALARRSSNGSGNGVLVSAMASGSNSLTSQPGGSGSSSQPLSANIQLTETLLVPKDKVGLIIGRNGVTIRDLQERSGARIQFSKDSPEVALGKQHASRPVTITGTRECINSARSLILGKVDLTAPNDETSATLQQQNQLLQNMGQRQQLSNDLQQPSSHQQDQQHVHQHQLLQHHQYHQQQLQHHQHQGHAGGNAGNGMAFPSNQSSYHTAAAQYIYPGYAAEPSLGYTHYPQQVSYDQNDQHALLQRSQLAYYQQLSYGYPSYAQTGNPLASVSTGAQHMQAHLVQHREQPSQISTPLNPHSVQRSIPQQQQQYSQTPSQTVQVGQATQLMQQLHVQSVPLQDQQYVHADSTHQDHPHPQFDHNGYQYTSGTISGQNIADARSSESASGGATIANLDAPEHMHTEVSSVDILAQSHANTLSDNPLKPAENNSICDRVGVNDATQNQQMSNSVKQAVKSGNGSSGQGHATSSQRDLHARQVHQQHIPRQPHPSQPEQTQLQSLQSQQRVPFHSAHASRNHVPKGDSNSEILENQAAEKALGTA
jgi:rRNA processing protein Krr1/Pno1